MGSGMSNKMWDILVEHAKTCVLSGNLNIYYADNMRNVVVVFNNIYELSGLISGGQYFPVDSLSDGQKVDTLVKKAYDNWMHVVEYDGKSLLSFTQNKNSGASQSHNMMAIQNYSSSFDHQLSLPSLPASVHSEKPSMNLGPNRGDYDDNAGTRYPIQSQNTNLSASSSQEDRPQRSENGLALGSFQASISEFQAGGNTILSSYSGVDYIPEEEIRMRSHEILENEDIQHLLWLFNMGGQSHASINVAENNLYSTTYMPNHSSN